MLRGRPQVLHLYGSASARPLVLASGDGGWMHLAPHAAEFLAGKGYFVVGLDARAYLESFTRDKETLRPEDEPGDFKVLADYAASATGERPILIGISEGAGLAVMAATDAGTRRSIAGVIALGLPDINELGWRWRDSVIYLTHGVPNEPTFSAAALIAGVSPAPIAAIHSSNDEFIPVPVVQKMFDAAREPKKLWIVAAEDHRFSGNLDEFDKRLLEAIDWVTSNVSP